MKFRPDARFFYLKSVPYSRIGVAFKTTYFFRFVINLQCQFSCWRQNECHRQPFLAFVDVLWIVDGPVLVDQIQYWHKKCSRFAGTGLCAGHQIPFGHYDRHGIFLDRRGLFIFAQLYVAHYDRMEVTIGKRLDGQRRVFPICLNRYVVVCVEVDASRLCMKQFPFDVFVTRQWHIPLLLAVEVARWHDVVVIVVAVVVVSLVAAHVIVGSLVVRLLAIWWFRVVVLIGLVRVCTPVLLYTIVHIRLTVLETWRWLIALLALWTCWFDARCLWLCLPIALVFVTVASVERRLVLILIVFVVVVVVPGCTCIAIVVVLTIVVGLAILVSV